MRKCVLFALTGAVLFAAAAFFPREAGLRPAHAFFMSGLTGLDLLGERAPSDPADTPIAQVCETLASAAQAHDLPVDFFARLIWQESRFNSRVVSRAGAQGVAQFMPRTAASYGLRNPFDPLAALPASARFLAELRDQFGNLGLAAAAYNAGPGRVQNWLARRGALPAETRNYVRIITGQPPEKWTDDDKAVELARALPEKAPCEGVAGLSRDKNSATLPVQLADNIAKIIQTAEAEAARAARAAAAKLAAVKEKARRGASRVAVLARKAKDAEKAGKVAALKKGRGRAKFAESRRKVRVADARK
ncbi:MAG: lytic transglycosylase domain-containing protein [Pseudorhodoplanes sp.]